MTCDLIYVCLVPTFLYFMVSFLPKLNYPSYVLDVTPAVVCSYFQECSVSALLIIKKELLLKLPTEENRQDRCSADFATPHLQRPQLWYNFRKSEEYTYRRLYSTNHCCNVISLSTSADWTAFNRLTHHYPAFNKALHTSAIYYCIFLLTLWPPTYCTADWYSSLSN